MAEVLINLGSGIHKDKPEPGEIRVDRIAHPLVDVVCDLEKFPWPFADNFADRVWAIHLVEHLRCLLVPFMDEAWRILKPGGEIYIETPNAGASPDLQWCDPTHVRCYRKHSFINYFTPFGISKFGYTDKPWSILHIEERSDGCLVVHMMPIRKL
jgi:predicted SAM-dependent methyltransferase